MIKPTYYSTSLRSHHITPYVQTSKISTSPQWSKDDVSIKAVIVIQYLLMPRTVIFMSSPLAHALASTSQICVLSVDFTHSRPIYSLHSQTSPKYIFPSLLCGNQVIVILILTLTLIDKETSLISGNRVVVTPKPNVNKETQRNWQIVFSPFLSEVK